MQQARGEGWRAQRTGVAVAGGLTAERFSALYETHVDRIYAYLARRLGPDLGEELTAQTFSEAWAGRARFDPDLGSFTAWVYGIASNLAARHHRQESRRLRAYARTGVDACAADQLLERSLESLAARQRWPSVAAGLARLRPVERSVLLLWAWDDLSYQEIAIALEIPVGTVRSRLSRARAKLSDVRGDR